jgi:hypothetical protein
MNRVVEVARRVGQGYRRLGADAITQLTPAFCGS